MRQLRLGSGRTYEWNGAEFFCIRDFTTPPTSDALRLIDLLQKTDDCDVVAVAKYLQNLGLGSIPSVQITGTRHALDWIKNEQPRRRQISTGQLRRILARTPDQCTWCGGVFLAGGQNLCSKKCVDEFLSRCDIGHIRRRVKRRDNGICARCDEDTEALRKKLAASPNDVVLREVLRSKGFNLDGPLWEMDHIVPVHRGGGLCDETGYQTLCIPCHKEKTAGKWDFLVSVSAVSN